MLDALWLTLSLPLWYLPAVLAYFSLPPFSLLPAIGILCLITGLVLAIRTGYRMAGIMAWSLLLTHVMVFIAGLVRAVGLRVYMDVATLTFFALSAGLLGYLWWKCRSTPAQATLFAAFAATYAIWGAALAAPAIAAPWR